MFEKILFATDFSEYSKKTLDCIAGFPGACHVILFHVIDEAISPHGGGEIGEALSFAEGRLIREEMHYLEKLNPDIRVTTAVRASSDKAGAITDAAEEQGASLIVVSARGSSLIDGILLGSVSGAVLRRSRTSVLVIRHKTIEGLEGKAYEQYCPRILSRILCPVDFSEYSDNAVALLGRTQGVGEVILLHVVAEGDTEPQIEKAIGNAKDRLEKYRTVLLEKGIDARMIVRRGNPAAEITRTADDVNASVIWMSSFGRGWFRDFLIGTTAFTVTLNARQPVIVIRRAGPRSTDPHEGKEPERRGECRILP